MTWTDGGAHLGSNGVVYAVSSDAGQEKVHPDLGGGVRAHRLEDGKLLWQRSFKRPVYTWPVVAELRKGDGLSVVVSIGAMGGLPPAFFDLLGVLLGAVTGCCCSSCRTLLHACCCRFRCLKALRHLRIACLVGPAVGLVLFLLLFAFVIAQWNGYPAEIWALEAATGAVRWRYELPAYKSLCAAGDVEGFWTRISKMIRPVCLPNAFSSPTVDAAGVVFIGYQDGRLYAIQDRDGDGHIVADEVATYDAGTAFLQGPAITPGVLAFTTCDSLHVFNF